MKAGRLAALGFALILPGVLSGCSSNEASDYNQYFAAVRQGLTDGFGGQPVTRTEAAAIRGAGMGYRIGDGPEHLLALASDTAGNLLWTSSDHIVLLTRDGRITRTVGLPHDLSALASPDGKDLTAPTAALKAPYSLKLEADFQDIGIYSLPIRCVAAAKGRETIAILGRTVATVRVDETCRSDLIGWSFTNSFWVDPADGLVRRSVQYIHPKDEKLETELFRPPG